MRPDVMVGRDFQSVDGSLAKKMWSFVQKLQQDDALPGLHIEPLIGTLDPRVRTGRVDLNHRAVLVRLDTRRRRQYVLVGAYPHDEAIERAKRLRVTYHPELGLTDIDEVHASEARNAAGAVTSPDEGAMRSSGRPVEQRLGNREHNAASIPERSNPFAALGDRGSAAAADLGVVEDLIDRARAAATEEELLEVLSSAPSWQGTVILELATGKTPDAIRQDLGLQLRAPASDETDDERVLAGLNHPAARMDFTYIGEDSEVLRDAIESGDFAAWRTFLHPQQSAFVQGRWNGAARISGGAGTGKTVVLVHRAVALTREAPSRRVVATTFTNALADGLEASVRSLDHQVPRATGLGQQGLLVRSLDKLVASVVSAADGSDASLAMNDVFGTHGAIPGGILGAGDEAQAWAAAALEAVRTGDVEASVATPDFLRDEYLAVVLPQRVTTRDEYLRAPRRGRGVALNRAKRQAVWRGVETYRSKSRASGGLMWPERAHVAAAVLDRQAERTGERPADHVLVDEGQDLHEGHWMFLRALVAAGPDDLFVSEDSQQRIYGRQVVLRRLGINIVGRSRRLTLNYRTTKQNLDFAVRALRGLDVRDVEDLEIAAAAYTSARSGPAPEVIEAETEDAEYEIIADRLMAWEGSGDEADPRDLGDTAVVVYTNDQVRRAVEGLTAQGLPVQQYADGPGDRGRPVVLTMHKAKGLEFRVVAMPGFGKDGPLGNLRRFAAGAEREAELVTRRALVYVAATRARDGLMVTHVGDLADYLA